MVATSAHPASRVATGLTALTAFLFACLARAEDFIFGDGFDGPPLAASYFVSPQGLDSNPGTIDLPFLTITRGITAAAGDSTKRNVLVAGGTYDESVSVSDGVNLYGGYQAGTWERTGNDTIIAGVSSNGSHDSTVMAINITLAPTTFDGFIVYGSVNGKAGGNSYAIYVAGSNGNLQITHNMIFGGQGGPGMNGSTGPDGVNGTAGSGRNPNLTVADALYDAFNATGTAECNTSNNRQYSNGGGLSCAGTSVSGGDGGGNRCPVMSYCDTFDANYGCLPNASNFHWNNYTPLPGAAGASSGGASDGAGGGGAAQGSDMIQIWANFSGGYICYVPPSLTYGLDGGSGGDGSPGASVSGCSASGGTVVSGDWVGGTSNIGIVGGNGGGGGGGGAGGGGKCESDGHGHTTCTDGTGKDSLGGHGGGGGSGGCGGAGGIGGGSGGGAFGIFIVSGSAPVVMGNQIFAGAGGGGGNGGNGGLGGTGGRGGAGGTTGVPVVFCTDVAGGGGSGGNGGDGSGGGGGCGGSSFGIYTFGVGTPNYCQAAANNTFVAGSTGAGGAGGLSLYNSAGAGADGTLADCSFN